MNPVPCLNDWTTAIENHEFTDVAYLDIAKAFDTVIHSKLLYKLEKLGVRGSLLTWLKSFLSNRTQNVTINNACSDTSSVTSGILQGSVLGPVLFRAYIDDITFVVKNCTIYLFADDTKLYLRVLRNQVSQFLLDDLHAVFNWCKVWQLS